MTRERGRSLSDVAPARAAGYVVLVVIAAFLIALAYAPDALFAQLVVTAVLTAGYLAMAHAIGQRSVGI